MLSQNIEKKQLTLKNRKRWRRLALLLAVSLLGVLSVAFIRETLSSAQTFYGVEFPAGKISFADAVVAYEPIIYLNEEQLSNVTKPFNNPAAALGTPDSSNPQHPLPSISERRDVSLGLGGSITLKFTNNLLTGSGDNAPDLWIFEAGEIPESVLVEISQDGQQWHAVGQTGQQDSGINIDTFGWGPDDFFSYIRLSDNPNQGEHDGVWNDGEWVGWGGADIDAVGAISSVSVVQSVSDF